MEDQNDESAKQNSSAEVLTKEMGKLSFSPNIVNYAPNEQTPEQPEKFESKTKDTAGNTSRQLFPSPASTDTAETTDGEWLKEHPWENEAPDDDSKKMSNRVKKSTVYTVPEDWCTKDEVELDKIYSELPKFIEQMKGPSSRQDLDCLLETRNLYGVMQLTACNSGTPHILELVQEKEGVKPKDKRSDRTREQDDKYKAFSVAPEAKNNIPLSEKEYWYLDCEYMLKMSLPAEKSKWFMLENGSKRIREIIPKKKDERWIFIPSYRRSEIALLDWPKDDIVTEESTIRIIVVRPSQFDKYVEKCGQMFPVISLPQDEIGVGYPRFWIQKIALRLKLDFIWMIDDSVECFYEYNPEKPPPDKDYKKYRRRPFGRVFKHIEKLVKESKSTIAAMSPRVFRGTLTREGALNDPFVCSPPRCAVFLNLKALKEKDVYYRPELKHKEDMMFGYECEQNGLKVFLDNRIHLQDHHWKDTGAMSPSVQQHQTEDT